MAEAHPPLDTMRHSAAHLMAQAITRVFKGEHVEFGVGPVIDTGFYYDVALDRSITESDLKKIEKEMKKIIKEKLPIERRVLPRDEAIKHFKKEGQKLKVELIESFPEGEEIGLYAQGEFEDLCRGPHVENTGQIPMAFKLLHVAGAYWRGDSDNQMLQRVYAACFETKEELKEHLRFLEEAKKRDHRKLGNDLDLFHFHSVAPGSPFFMPKGALIYNELVDFVRTLYGVYGYKEVITPQILDSELWHTSGHYDHYKENMYFTEIDERDFAVKPMNCPCHMLMFDHQKYSYRDLPLRFADFGRLHRYEKSGAVSGLTRVRTFCQDDAHIFLPIDKIQDEILNLLDMFFTCYEHFGLGDIRLALSTRPDKKAGEDAMWDKAEESLRQALEKSGRDFSINEGDGAFYGPKIDIGVADALKRYHQLGTVQLDFHLPERFNLRFTNQKGEMERPVVIHRALLGSLERFFGVYLEHTGGVFPFWLAPEQLVIIPVNNENHLDYAKNVAAEFRSLGIRVRLDDRNESLGKKTRETQKGKIPFMIVVGDNEKDNQSISARAYGQRDTQEMKLDEAKKFFSQKAEEKIPEKIRDLVRKGETLA